MPKRSVACQVADDRSVARRRFQISRSWSGSRWLKHHVHRAAAACRDRQIAILGKSKITRRVPHGRKCVNSLSPVTYVRKNRLLRCTPGAQGLPVENHLKRQHVKRPNSGTAEERG